MLSFDPTSAALIGLMMGVVLVVAAMNETRSAASEGLLQGRAVHPGLTWSDWAV